MTTRAGTVAGVAGKAQHVDLWRKVNLRRELLARAIPGPAYVPFIGDGDIAAELYANRPIYGCDLDQARVDTASARLPHADVRVADADGWPFADVAVPFTVADLDAYSNPYHSLEAFWHGAQLADVVALFRTDGLRLAVKISTTKHLGPLPDAAVVRGDMPTRRRQFNAYWTGYVRPYLVELVAPGAIVAETKYQRQHMLYWGVVVDRRAHDAGDVAPPADTRDPIARVEDALLEAAASGNVPAAIFWLEHKGGPTWQKPSAAQIAEELGRPLRRRRA